MIVNQLDGVHEAYALRAVPASQAAVIHHNAHTRQAIYLGADLGRDIWQDLPQAAAWAAVADGHQPFPGTRAQPDHIQLVAPDHVHQTRLPAARNMLVGLFI